ncbi:hypothetical protein C8F01DRAFT_191845 [Mycena amicta]|nr:hypothetical protein C8F01DRAFT_191845 [Mycena amicta]
MAEPSCIMYHRPIYRIQQDFVYHHHSLTPSHAIEDTYNMYIIHDVLHLIPCLRTRWPASKRRKTEFHLPSRLKWVWNRVASSKRQEHPSYTSKHHNFLSYSSPSPAYSFFTSFRTFVLVALRSLVTTIISFSFSFSFHPPPPPPYNPHRPPRPLQPTNTIAKQHSAGPSKPDWQTPSHARACALPRSRQGKATLVRAREVGQVWLDGRRWSGGSRKGVAHAQPGGKGSSKAVDCLEMWVS